METVKGTLYGVSVGPGDPELITLKSLRIIRECPVIAAPQTKNGEMLALKIVSRTTDLSQKTIVPLHFTMSRDRLRRQEAHRAAAETLRAHLDAGRDIAMLNLGDVSIYASFGHLQKLLERQGYRTAMAAGVPSFCAMAARLNRPLTGGMDVPLTVAPGNVPLDRVLAAQGTKVLMKSGRQMPQVLDQLRQAGLLQQSAAVCNCGLPGEEVWPDLSTGGPVQDAGYFITVFVK